MLHRLRLILSALDAAGKLEDLDRPSLRLHVLKGDLKGLFAVTVRANRRVVFRFEEGAAWHVDFVDYP